MAFKKWEVKLQNKDSKKLTHEGQNEMINIAERMQSRVRNNKLDLIFSIEYKFQFKYTDSQRTKKSAYYFTIELYGKDTAKYVSYPQPSKRDPILRVSTVLFYTHKINI